jgi:hypothetical protein
MSHNHFAWAFDEIDICIASRIGTISARICC